MHWTTNRPAVAPFEPCVACCRGDTTSGLVLIGDVEWIAGNLMALGALDTEADGIILALAEQKWGCDTGKVPDRNDLVVVVRLCRDCAVPNRLVGEFAAGALPGYVQPDSTWRGQR